MVVHRMDFVQVQVFRQTLPGVKNSWWRIVMGAVAVNDKLIKITVIL